MEGIAQEGHYAIKECDYGNWTILQLRVYRNRFNVLLCSKQVLQLIILSNLGQPNKIKKVLSKTQSYTYISK